MKARQSPWILLRGLTRDSHHWADFPRLLAKQDAGPPPLMLDLPGNGRLNHEPSPTRIEHMAEYCRAETRRRGVEPPKSSRKTGAKRQERLPEDRTHGPCFPCGIN